MTSSSILRTTTRISSHIPSPLATRQIQHRSFASSLQLQKMSAAEVNATGLKPEESRKLEKRQPREDEADIVRCAKELYSSKPTNDSYTMYADDATFHDPVSIARPLASIKSQFNGLPKIFSSSTIDRFDLLKSPASLPSPPGPDQFTIVDQDVTYYRKGEKFKTVNSLLTFERNASGKVVRHTEEWDHNKVTDSSDGFLGSLNEWRKKAMADIIGTAVPSDASKK